MAAPRLHTHLRFSVPLRGRALEQLERAAVVPLYAPARRVHDTERALRRAHALLGRAREKLDRAAVVLRHTRALERQAPEVILGKDGNVEQNRGWMRHAKSRFKRSGSRNEERDGGERGGRPLAELLTFYISRGCTYLRVRMTRGRGGLT